MNRFFDFLKKYIRESGKSIFDAMGDTGERGLQNVSPTDGPETRISWKQKALDNFKTWFDEMPADKAALDKFSAGQLGTDAGDEMDGCDLYTLLSEFAGLRQEIKLQNREQNRALRTQTDIVEAYRDGLEVFKKHTAELALLEEKIRLTAEKKTALLFLDIRDALVRGLAHSREAANAKSFFRRPAREIKGISEGYEMALRRFDRALSLLQIVCINTVNQPFDPQFMQAIDRRKVSDRPPGTVIEEYSGGFLWKNDVLRTAKVVVSE
jgi:molecular chaperone GrpE